MGGPRLVDDDIARAVSSYGAGEFRQSRQLALSALESQPDDPRLLRLAGRSSLELDLDDAVGYLRRAAELAPDDAEAWRDLALALINAGETRQAAEALREVVRLNPDESIAATDLAHLIFILGQTDEAVELLSQVVELEPGNVGALRSLFEMQRARGNLEAALLTAQAITRVLPDDIVARLDCAELNLTLGKFTPAVADYVELRRIDDEPRHLAYAYHGLILVEVQRSNWRRALDHAIDATRVDRDDVTTQLLAFIAARLFGDASRETLTQRDVEALLAAEHVQHRREHVEASPLP